MELERPLEAVVGRLRAAGYAVATPEQVVQLVASLLASQATHEQRWQAIHETLHQYAGWLETARQQTTEGSP